MQQLT